MKFRLFGRLKKDEQAQQDAARANEAAPRPQAPQQRGSSRPLPEERVTFLISQGFAEPEIIKVLKDEGYSFQEIDSGITNVLKRQVSSEPSFSSEAPFEGTQSEDLSPVFRPNPAEISREEVEQQKKEELVEEMNEVIETLMEEKFSKVLDDLDKVDKRFAELNERLRQVNDRVSAFENQEKTSDTSVSEKISEVNVKEENIEPRIASLEKAFKDIIPNLVDSIREVRETLASARRRDAPARDSESGTNESDFEGENEDKASIFD